MFLYNLINFLKSIYSDYYVFERNFFQVQQKLSNFSLKILLVYSGNKGSVI